MTGTMVEPNEAEKKLKRFLYLCTENFKYSVPNKNLEFCNKEQISSFFELLSAGKEESVLKLVEVANRDCLCGRRETILFVLAACTRHFKLDHMKSSAYDLALKVCVSSEEFILFIKFAHFINKNFSHGLRRLVRQYYSKYDTAQLTDLITQCQSYHGWSHRDIIKLCHLKPKHKAEDILLTYIMKNLEEAKKKIDSSATTAEIDDIVKKIERIDFLKHCQDENKAILLFIKDKYVVQQVSSHILKAQMVWDVLIPNLGIPALLTELSRLNRLGFLKENSSTLQKINDEFSDSKICQYKIQPAQVLIYLKTFERGKPIDPQKKKFLYTIESMEYEAKAKNSKKTVVRPSLPKNNAIVGCLYHLLQGSFQNLHPTSRRLMITMDVRGEPMGHLCFVNKSIQCLEAAALIALSFIKCEKDIIVAVFQDSVISVVEMESGLSYNQFLQKLNKMSGGGVLLSSTFAWALQNKKEIDVFINLFHSADSFYRVPKKLGIAEDIFGSMNRYKETLQLPQTKMINVSLGNKKLNIADGSSADVFDICGFDHYVPKIIEACCKGVFQ